MKDIDTWLEEVEDALDEGAFEEALDLADRALRDHPGAPWLLAYRGEALAGDGEVAEAIAAYEEAVRRAPDAPELHEALADLRFRAARFAAAREAADAALALDAGCAGALDILARIAERDGDVASADRLIARARAAGGDLPRPVRLLEADFREVVTEALEHLPDEFAKALRENLAIVVEPVPSESLLTSVDPPLDPTVLGYYVGVPLPEREPSQSPPPLPDVIYLFQRNLEHECDRREVLLAEIATTVYHEVAHFLGFDEDEMEELGLE
jgi:predicted Zn-dependent protease with MMP-like domain